MFLGWQALWRISRVICENLNLKYPTIVYGTVEQVFFNEMKAIFIVHAIQEDDDIKVPLNNEVPLEDLWPTIGQENSAINIDITADAIDALRFFFRNVWMPWDDDNDDDIDWAAKHLESRIRFFYDLKTNMNRGLAAHVRLLLSEAKYIKERREFLELGLSDDEEEDDSNLSNGSRKKDLHTLMGLHLRLAQIKNEFEMLENPDMRTIYKEIKFPQIKTNSFDNVDCNVFIVTKVGTLDEQSAFIEMAKTIIGEKKLVKLCTTLQVKSHHPIFGHP